MALFSYHFSLHNDVILRKDVIKIIILVHDKICHGNLVIRGYSEQNMSLMSGFDLWELMACHAYRRSNFLRSEHSR